MFGKISLFPRRKISFWQRCYSSAVGSIARTEISCWGVDPPVQEKFLTIFGCVTPVAKRADCKSVTLIRFVGSSPTTPTILMLWQMAFRRYIVRECSDGAEYLSVFNIGRSFLGKNITAPLLAGRYILTYLACFLGVDVLLELFYSVFHF